MAGRQIPVLAMLAMLMALAPSAASAYGDSRCVTADVPGPMVMPDGTAHEAGQLKLCLSQDYSPVAGLHEVYLDGRPLGMMVSRSRTNESAGEDLPVVVFDRAPSGVLRLAGYTSPDGGKMRTYWLEGGGFDNTVDTR